MSDIDFNQILLDYFASKRDEARAENDNGRVIHNNRMIGIIRRLRKQLTSLSDLDGIKGVGKGTKQKIVELAAEHNYPLLPEIKTPLSTKPDPPSAPKRKRSTERTNDQSRIPKRALFGNQGEESTAWQDVNVEEQSVVDADSAQNLPIPDLLLAHPFDADKHDATGLFWSEKLDGMRAFWCGKRLWTRNKISINAPKWFTDQLPPNLTLDGELFVNRGCFQETISIVRKHKPVKEEWEKISFQVFDTLDHADKVFTERLQILEQEISPDNKVVKVVQHSKCESNQHAKDLLDQVVGGGGEGIMLREPQSLYEGKRSKSLLKMKPFYDAEARVIGHEDGKGRNAGRLGALVCEMQCGKKFKVGSGLSDIVRNDPPAIGAIITYSFNELTKSGVPRFPTFVRVSDKTEAHDFQFSK